MTAQRLGRTDVELPELGLGCAPLGDLFEQFDEDVADATVRAAWESGNSPKSAGAASSTSRRASTWPISQ